MSHKSNPGDWLYLAAFASCMVVAYLPTILKYSRKVELLQSNGDMTRLSTKETYFHARIKPKFVILVAAVLAIFVSIIIFNYNNYPLALFTILGCFFPIAVPLLDIKIKEVYISDTFFAKNDFNRVVSIPFGDIKQIQRGNSKITASYIKVKFATKTVFGNSIYFKPADLNQIKSLLQSKGIRLVDSWEDD